MARSVAPVVPERGREGRPLFSFSRQALRAVALAALYAISPGCTSGDARPITSPETVTQQRIERGFAEDLGTAPTLGHSVPVEGEIISTPPCVSEARAGQDCRP